LEQLCETQPTELSTRNKPESEPGYFYALNDLLLQSTAAASHVSDEISSTYFTHSGETKQSLGA
jgi:hypothetical protein